MEKIIFKQILSKNPLTYDEENPKDFYFSIPRKTPSYRNNNNNAIWFNQSDVDMKTRLQDIVGNYETVEYQAFAEDGTKLGMILRGTENRDNYLLYEEETKIGLPIYNGWGNNVYLVLNYKYLPSYENDEYTILDVLEKARESYESKTSVYTKGMGNYDNALFIPCYIDDNYLYSSVWGSPSTNYTKANFRTRYFSSWYKLVTGNFYKEDELFKMELIDGRKFVFTKILDYGTKNSSVLDVNVSSEIVTAEPSYAVKDLIYGTDLSHFCSTVSIPLTLKNGVNIAFTDKGNNNLLVTVSRTYKGKYNAISFFVTKGIFGSNNLSYVDVNCQMSFDGFTDTSRSMLGFNLAINPIYNDIAPENLKAFLEAEDYSGDDWKKNLARIITLLATVGVTTSEEMRNKYGYITGETGDAIGQYSFIGVGNFSGDTFISAGSNSTLDISATATMEDALDWEGFIDFSDGPEPEPEPEPEPTPVKKRTSKLNIKELSQMAIKNGVPLLGDVEKLQPFAFMSEYLEDYEMFDEDLGETRGFYWPLWNVENGTEEEVLEHFRKRSAFTIKKHKTEIEGFKAIDDARWNPIENYDRYETNSTKRSGKDTVKDMFDGVNVTNEYGQQGSSTTTGEQTGSNTVGQHTSTTTNEHAGFNSSNYQKDGKSTTDSGSQTSNSTVGARTDSASIDAHTDNMITEAREDVHETAYDNTTEFETHIHGNIGVTTATQMLEEAKDFYSKWNFYNKLFDLILSELAIYYEE